MIEVRDLRATAGDVTLVDGVSFDVRPGAVTALVGASGSGKTTTALALLGECAPGVRLHGAVRVGPHLVVDGNGATAAAASVRGRLVAYMPQHPGSALNPARRIGSTLRELVALHRAGMTVDDALAAAQLPAARELLRRFPHQFSGGQRQRIALAQALACGPATLVLDEPSSGLDSVTRLQLAAELAGLARAGLGILLLSHDLALVRALADHVVVLDRGRVTAAGRPEAALPAYHVLEPGWADTPVGEPVLTATKLSARVKRATVLRDVDLALAPGECLGVVGRSGSGKTTLARCLAGLHERYDGRLMLGEEPLPVLRKRSAELVRRVQYVWQEVRGSFDDRRAVIDQVARTAVRLRGLSDEAARHEAYGVLEELGVAASTAARRPGSLSGGELQRAALARALVARPDVLICDEITTALDDGGTRRVLRVLGRLKERGTALVWIGHDLRLVGAVADRLVVLDAGRVVEHGRPDVVLADPRATETQRLMRAAALGEQRLRAAS